MKTEEFSENIKTVLVVLQDEANGDVSSALRKLADEYSMTWVYQKSDGTLFPATEKNIEKELEEIYPIRNRKYVIKNIAEGDHVVMVELIESYPDPESEKMYRTPLVLVLEMEDGKICTGRHYCDPALSFLELSDETYEQIYKKRKSGDTVIDDQR